jgi:hypothetical protein
MVGISIYTAISVLERKNAGTFPLISLGAVATTPFFFKQNVGVLFLASLFATYRLFGNF